MTEIATRPPSAAAAVTVEPGAVLKALGLNPANPLAQAMVLVCQRYDLDPVLKHVGIYDDAVYVHLAGYLHIANRHPSYRGIETIREWDDERYYHAEVRVHRSDRDFAFQRRGKSLKEKPKKNGGTYIDEHADAKAYGQACRRALRMAFNLDLGEDDFDPIDPPEPPAPVVEVARRIEQTSEAEARPAGGQSRGRDQRAATPASDPNAAAAGPGDTDVASAGHEPPKAAAPTAPPSPSPGGGAAPASRGRGSGRAAAPGRDAAPTDAPPAAPTQPTLDEPDPPVEQRSAVVAWCLTNHVPAGQARQHLASEYHGSFGADGPDPLATVNDLMALEGDRADRAVAYLQAALEANVFEPDGWRP